MDSFFRSFHQDLKNYNLNLIGGDTISTKNKTVLSLTIFGPVKSKRIIKRSSAKLSDLIYVSGTIGDAFIGMSIKKKQIIQVTPEAKKASPPRRKKRKTAEGSSAETKKTKS